VLWLLVCILWVALFMLANTYFFIYGAMHQGILPIWLSILQQILAFFMNTFVVPISATGITLFYYDQRVRKEGYDIEWMMQGAGLTVPQPAAPVAAAWLPAAPEQTSEPALEAPQAIESSQATEPTSEAPGESL
jgi:hypothetical protein